MLRLLFTGKSSGLDVQSSCLAQLFRVPNLLTVPGDPLAGFLLATGGRLDARVVPAVFACLCLYAAGLVINDLADQKEDTIDRPNRPLPSGAFSRGAAIIVAGNLIIFGLGLCAVITPAVAFMGVGALMSILLYDFLTKKIPVIGALTMGACRGGSILVGAAAGFGPDIKILWTAFALEPISGALALPLHVFAAGGQQRFIFGLGARVSILLYIAAVTNLARHETQSTVPKISRMLPLGALLIGYAVLKSVTGSLLLDAAPTLWVLGSLWPRGSPPSSCGIPCHLCRRASAASYASFRSCRPRFAWSRRSGTPSQKLPRASAARSPCSRASRCTRCSRRSSARELTQRSPAPESRLPALGPYAAPLES